MKSIALIAISTMLVISPGARAALTDEERKMASDLYKEFKAAKDDLPKRTEIVEEMVILGSDVAKVIHPIIDREFRDAAKRYMGGFNTQTKTVASKKGARDQLERIQRLRAAVQGLRRKGGALSKEDIVKIGDPAIAELRKLTTLRREEILASSAPLAEAREQLIELGKQRNACIDALLLIDLEEFDPDILKAEEHDIASNALNTDRDARQILDQNKRLAEKIEPAEADGIRDLNELRMLIGLKPCLIDPNLCAASRDHSKDMSEKNFFSHDSPIPGKRTPWVRAKNHGTNANAENIYVGSSSGKSANRSWWHSPGHHRNMLSPGARRVGMGLHGKHWTQMFGG